MLTMLTTLANDDGGAGQIGLPMISLSGPNDAQALMATKFANDVPTLDFPAAAAGHLDKSLWTIPGRSTADIIMLAVALFLAATLFAAWAFSSARSRVIQPPSGGWRPRWETIKSDGYNRPSAPYTVAITPLSEATSRRRLPCEK